MGEVTVTLLPHIILVTVYVSISGNKICLKQESLTQLLNCKLNDIILDSGKQDCLGLNIKLCNGVTNNHMSRPCSHHLLHVDLHVVNISFFLKYIVIRKCMYTALAMMCHCYTHCQTSVTVSTGNYWHITIMNKKSLLCV